MRLLLVGLLLLAGCVSAPAKPAAIGMTVDQYRMSCPLDGMIISQGEDLVIGECRDKPAEYVEFRAGRVVSVMTEPQMFDRLVEFRCKGQSDFEKCRNVVLQKAAQHAASKAKAGQEARKDEWDRTVGSLRFSINGGDSSAAESGVMPMSGQICQFIREVPANMNKICYYDCLGTTVAENLSSTALCPLTMSR